MNQTKTNMAVYYVGILLVMVFGIQACSFPETPNNVPVVTITFPPSPTNTALPTVTPIPTLTSTPINPPNINPTSTSTAVLEVNQRIQASVAVDTLNVRQGPGTVFEIIQKLTSNAVTTIIGIAPGEEWVEIDIGTNLTGWVSVDFLAFDGDLKNVEEKHIDFAHIVQGRVLDDGGNPIESITVAVYQSTNSQNLRTDSKTNAEGYFFAYLPLSEKSLWQVEVVGIGCSSRIVDADCNFSGRFEPVGFTIALPLTPDRLVFVYDAP